AVVWDLVWTMRRFLAHQGHWHDEIDALTIALAAAERLGDPLKQAHAHCYLGTTYVWFGKYEDARSRFDVALELYREADDRIGQAYVHFYISGCSSGSNALPRRFRTRNRRWSCTGRPGARTGRPDA